MSKSKKPVIVLGMHRSGTSCLAGSLHESGVYFGDVSKENQFNKKGNRENNEIMLINDSILDHNHGSWENPPKSLQWTQKHYEQGTKIIKKLDDNSGNNSWGFKDPRALLTLPFWDSLLNSYNLVGTIRHPFNVALSLKKRDPNYNINKGLKLWLLYNQALLKIIKTKEFPLISFDLPEKEYQEKLNLIKSNLSLSHNDSNEFFDNQLRTQNNTIDYQYHPEIQSCLKELESFLI